MKQGIKQKVVIFYTRCCATFKSSVSKFKFKIFKNEGQEMLFYISGTFIFLFILLILEIKERLQ
jgi:hypothetical protein